MRSPRSIPGARSTRRPPWSDPPGSRQPPPPLLLQPRPRPRSGTTSSTTSVRSSMGCGGDSTAPSTTRPSGSRPNSHSPTPSAGARPRSSTTTLRRRRSAAASGSSPRRWNAPDLSAVLCYEITDRNGHDGAMDGLDENLSFFEAQRTDPRIRGMLGFHASFTVDDETLAGCRTTTVRQRWAATSTSPRTPSISGCPRWSTTPDPSNASGATDSSTTGLSPFTASTSEATIVRPWPKVGATIVHNPESNANNGVGRLDLEGAAADGCRIGLGTDGMSSAMLGALRAAFLGLRGGRRDPRLGFTVVPDLLAVNAEVAGRFLDEPLLGRLEPGAPADLCVLDSAPPTPVTPENVFAHLVYGSAGVTGPAHHREGPDSDGRPSVQDPRPRSHRRRSPSGHTGSVETIPRPRVSAGLSGSQRRTELEDHSSSA